MIQTNWQSIWILSQIKIYDLHTNNGQEKHNWQQYYFSVHDIWNPEWQVRNLQIEIKILGNIEEKSRKIKKNRSSDISIHIESEKEKKKNYIQIPTYST